MESARIESLPLDGKIYIVKMFGLTRSNPSPNASMPLVKVTLECIESKREIIIETIITHLVVLRLWSAWKDQVKIQEIILQKSEKFNLVSSRTYILDTRECKIAYLAINKNDGTRVMVEMVDKKSQLIISVFTVFSLKNGESVYVPSLEILFATYMPESHYMLRGLLSGDLEHFINQHLNKYQREVDEAGSCIYMIDPKRQFPYSTQYFLAYLSCNKESRKNVSMMRASMTINSVFLKGIKYTAIEVLPYHPEKFNIVVSGLYDAGAKRFWAYRIENAIVPIECKVGSIKRISQMKRRDEREDSQKYIASRQSVQKDIGLRDNVDAGINAGKKYVKSDVSIAVPEEQFIVFEEDGTGVAREVEAENKEARAASASPSSGQNESIEIAMVEYRNEHEEQDFNQVLLSVLEGIAEKKYFLDNQANRSIYPLYFRLEKMKTAADTYSNWAIIGKRRRRLIICEIIKNGQYLYLLDIERKNSDTYAGIAFALPYEIDAALLKDIGDAISKNQGRFNRNENKKRVDFPVEEYRFFYHSADEETMGRKIERLISLMLKEI